MKKSLTLSALVLALLGGLSPVAADPVILRGVDMFSTPADGKTFYDFADNPIPAGFFCASSKPFTGRVAFKGLPLATAIPGQLGFTDTVVERLDDAVLDDKGKATTRVQFRALSLVSIAPIKTACGAFHAYVSLNGKQRVTRMKIHRTEEGGGTFVAPLAVDIRLTFIPAKGSQGRNPKKLTLTGKFTFPGVAIPWSFTDAAKAVDGVVVDTDGDLVPDTRLPAPSNFSPLRPTKAQAYTPCCYEYVCHANEGHEHCSWVLPWGCDALCP